MERRFYLVDNGSLRPEAWRNLQDVAGQLSRLCGNEVRPASLLHSDRIPPEKLGGERASTLETALRRDLDAGERRFGIVPFFFGPSRALTHYVPQRIDALKQEFPGADITLAPCICPPGSGAEIVLAEILAERVRDCAQAQGLSEPPAVVLVDHGSPARAVTAVRDAVAKELERVLGTDASAVGPASMERRDGERYAFNDPLLEHRLSEPPFNGGDVVLAQLFLSPGKHAGPGGDIAEICASAEAKTDGRLRVHRAELLGQHPKLLALLAERVAAL